MNREIKKFNNEDDLSSAAAEFVAAYSGQCIENSGFFSIALSGGRSPLKLYEKLSDSRFEIPWKKVHFFWSDERYVPAGDSESNFKMSKEILLSKIDIPEGNIHRILTDVKPPEKCAEFYENDIKAFFLDRDKNVPSFDLILLGLGQDGHTASLFPGDPLLDENTKLVAASQAPRGMSVKNRITFTLPLINLSKSVLFLVLDANKKKILSSIFEDRQKSQLLYPGALVHPTETLYWYLMEE